MSNMIGAREVKTRKPHQCFGCLETFEAGSTMEVWTGTDAGQIFSLYTCKGCQRATQLSRLEDDEFWPGYTKVLMDDHGVDSVEALVSTLEKTAQ